MARIANDNPLNADKLADDNIVQPFELIESALRGRLVRLGSVIDDILSAHDYPEPVAHILAEAMGLGLILASMLKYDGIFTLQTSTDGPVKTLVVDVTSAGDLRAYAGFYKDAIEVLSKEQNDDTRYGGTNYGALVGEGYLAFTVDQGANTERYQGIVSIEGSSLSQSVQHYFDQSEQIDTYVRVAAGMIDQKWRCGAMMIQKLPDEILNNPENVVSLSDQTDGQKNTAKKNDDWNRSKILMETCTKEEFLAPDLDSKDLLTRLFHEEGVRIFEQKSITKGCRCTMDKVKNVILTLSPEEQEECFKDGVIEMTCEFCSKTYHLTKSDLAAPQ